MDYQFLLDRPAGQHRIGPRQRLLYANLRRAIERGRLGPNHRLPGSRELAQQLAIACNTVVYAYEQLFAEGYLISSKRGTSVAALQAPAARKTSKTARATRLSSRAQHASPVRDHSHDLNAFTPGLPALDAFPLSELRAAVQAR